ncbi:MAG: ABC transporter ATP-binding protein [Clostridia bacterium]|nr:ABC transporter ATP-binding protein [Clostridia bacterium]
METCGILLNKEISSEQFEMLEKKRAEVCNEDEKILFAIVGDLTLDAKYGAEIFVVTSVRSFVIEESGEATRVTLHTDVKSASVKRMYGNARLIFKDKDKNESTVFRFTYAVAALCETAADYIERMSDGEDEQRAFQAVSASYEKAMRVCPKCGRRLLHAGAECIACQSKRHILGKLIVYAKPELPNLILCMFLSLAATGLSMLLPMLTSTLVDDVIPHNDTAMLLRVTGFLFAAYFLQFIFGVIRSYRLRVSATNIVTYLRNSLFEKTQKLSMRFYDKTTTGSVINRVNGDSTTLEQFMVRLSQEVVVQLFTLVGIVVIMVAKNWRFAVVTLAPIPFIVVGTRIFGKKIAPYYRRNWRRWSAVVSNLTDTLPGVRVVKSFSAENRTSGTFSKYTSAWLDTAHHSARISTAFPNIVNFFVHCGQLLIWGVGGAWVILTNMNGGGGILAETTVTLAGGTVTIGTLVAFVSYASMFYNPVNFFANFNDSYQAALASAERVLDILDAEEEPDRGKGNCPVLKGKIEFKDVNFSYDRSKMTLQDVNFTIEEGDIVGIVGTTGSGKSTLVNLLMRFYDDYEGKITIDGIDIRDIDLSYFRGQIGYVQQESMMFRNTVYNNIAFSRPTATVEEVFAAADVANAHEFIARLPDGYDTMLGERGVGLSGGERQRVSIARTVLMNPSMLIFDEATASVDSETESLIQGAIEALIKGRTTIMIAHRLSTLRKANKIIVLDKGRILEMGTPEELLAAKGKYYKLVQIQTMAEQAEADKKEEGFE